MKVKDKLKSYLDAGTTAILPTKKGDNNGPAIGAIFYWQEVTKHAKEKLDMAWAVAVAEDLLDSDDVLREGQVGEERILFESNSFSVVAKLDKPRTMFSKDRFIAAVAKRYKLDPHQLEKLAEDCVTESKPPLSKRVLEV